MTTTASRVASRPINFSSSAPYFGGLWLVALIAFWPTYLSRPLTADTYTHLHALTATLWMLMLVAQPLAIRTKRLTLHRRLGRSSYALAPVVLMSMVLLAHSKTHGVSVAQNVGIYVPLSWPRCSRFLTRSEFSRDGRLRCTRASWYAPRSP